MDRDKWCPLPQVPIVVQAQIAVWMMVGTIMVAGAFVVPAAAFFWMMDWRWSPPILVEQLLATAVHFVACVGAAHIARRIWPASRAYRIWAVSLAGMASLSAVRPWADLLDPLDLPDVPGVWGKRPMKHVSGGVA